MNREERLAKGLSTQPKYEELLDEIATVRTEKVLSYGESYYTQEDPMTALTLVYGDLKRKLYRIETALKRGISSLEDGETLREAAKDMANYSLMLMQIYDRIEPKEKDPVPPINQISFSTKDPEKLKRLLNQIFGREIKWVEDTAIAVGDVRGFVATNEADLAFNRDIAKMEFEILNYTSGPNWLQDRQTEEVGLAHLGILVDNIGPFVERMENLGFKQLQRVISSRHTNPYLNSNGIRFEFVVFETKEVLGFDLKFIEKISPKEG